MNSGSERSLQMLSAALEKEQKGCDFYKDAAAKCANPLGKELFKILIGEEGIHVKRIQEIYDHLQGGKSNWPETWKSLKGENPDVLALARKRISELGSKVKPESSDLEAIEIGIQMEQGAIKFYEDQLAKAVEPLEKEFVTLMINEEHNHFAALSDMKWYFTDPEAWFIEKEKHGLDGA
jgi:rubrerythrin